MPRFILLITFVIPFLSSCECRRIPKVDVSGRGSKTQKTDTAPILQPVPASVPSGGSTPPTVTNTSSPTAGPAPRIVSFGNIGGDPKITWTISSGAPQGNYKIYKKSKSESSYSQIGSVPSTQNDFTDSVRRSNLSVSKPLFEEDHSYKVVFDPDDKTTWKQSPDSNVVEISQFPSSAKEALTDIIQTMRQAYPPGNGGIFIEPTVNKLSDMKYIYEKGDISGLFSREVHRDRYIMTYVYNNYKAFYSITVNGDLKGDSWNDKQKHLTVNGKLEITGLYSATVTFNNLVVSGLGNGSATSGSITVTYNNPTKEAEQKEQIQASKVPKELLNFP